MFLWPIYRIHWILHGVIWYKDKLLQWCSGSLARKCFTPSRKADERVTTFCSALRSHKNHGRELCDSGNPFTPPGRGLTFHRRWTAPCVRTPSPCAKEPLLSYSTAQPHKTATENCVTVGSHIVTRLVCSHSAEAVPYTKLFTHVQKSITLFYSSILTVFFLAPAGASARVCCKSLFLYLMVYCFQ